MYQPLVIPSRNLFEMFLCTIGAYVMTKIVFPPNDPPPSFPFVPWYNNNEKQD